MAPATLSDPALFVAPAAALPATSSAFLAACPLSARQRPRPSCPAAAAPARMRYRPEAPRQPSPPSEPSQPHADSTPPPPPPAPAPRRPSVDSNLHRVDADRVQTDPEENLRGFIKTRGSLIPGDQFVFWWVGDIYDMRDGQSSRHMFSFEGFNIGRMVRVDGGWRMLTREVGLYKDKATGEILDTWVNPDTGACTKCVHVWNDPVNQQFLLESARGKFSVPTTIQGDDIYWHSEVFLKYKSPLPRAEYPSNAASDLYQSTEMFQFFSKKDDLASDKPSAECLISWVRVGQWLPWMQMGDKPGKLVYHCRGRKLKSGYEDLSEAVRNYVQEHHPEYSSAPTNYTTPNETSWTYMKKLLDSKGSPRADGTVARPEPKTPVAPAGSGDVFNTKMEPLRLTANELSLFDGRDPQKPIYLSLAGRVFDVSSARRHYRKGETYNCLTGKDASFAFISGDLSEPGLCNAAKIDLNNLTDDQQNDLDRWVGFFAKTYPEVGVFVDY